MPDAPVLNIPIALVGQTDMEIKAERVALAAARNWEGISLVGVAELGVVGFEYTVEQAATFAVLNGAFPDCILVEGITPTLGTYLVASAPTPIDQQKVDAYISGLESVIVDGDTLVWIQWAGFTGDFNSVMVLREAKVVWDSMISNMLQIWPPTTLVTGGPVPEYQITPSPTPPTGYKIEVRTGLGTSGALMKGSMNLQCNGGSVVNCSAITESSSGFLYSAKVITDAPHTFPKPGGGAGECCGINISMAWSSGFTSIEAEAGGFGLKITGSLGSGGAWTKPMQKCCQ